MAKIVVMGAGIGGISQIYELRKELGKEHELVLVGDSDYFEFTPSNPWVAVGWRKGQQIKVDLRDLMKKYGIEFNGGGVKRLHADENRLEMNDDSSIDYDYLVIATGLRLAFDDNGIGEFELLDDLRDLRLVTRLHAGAAALELDKKAVASGLRLVLLEAPGRAQVVGGSAGEDIRAAIDACR